MSETCPHGPKKSKPANEQSSPNLLGSQFDAAGPGEGNFARSIVDAVVAQSRRKLPSKLPADAPTFTLAYGRPETIAIGAGIPRQLRSAVDASGMGPASERPGVGVASPFPPSGPSVAEDSTGAPTLEAASSPQDESVKTTSSGAEEAAIDAIEQRKKRDGIGVEGLYHNRRRRARRPT